ncbi:MAG TPA: penicillin-binding protein activator [Guyparkeria sp.]|nr:penicillin-binding protein activator [Guyparkeria sp.]
MPTRQRLPAPRRRAATARQNPLALVVRAAPVVLFAAVLLILGGCAQLPTTPEPGTVSAAQSQLDQAIKAGDPTAIAQARMALSQSLSGQARAEQQLAALEAAIDSHDFTLAHELYQQADTGTQWEQINPRRAAIARGLGEWLQGERDRALNTIHRIPLPLDADSERRRLILLGAMQAEAGQPLAAARYYAVVDSQLSDNQQGANHARLWNLLAKVPAAQLSQAASSSTDPDFSGWLDLALTYRQHPGEIDRWVAAHPGHPAVASGFVAMLGSSDRLQSLRAPSAQGPVAVLLPETGRYAAISHEIRQGIRYAAENGALPGRELLFIDSGTDHLGARAAIEQAQRAGAALLIGPLLKEQIPALAALGPDGPLAIALNTPADGQPLPPGVVSFSLSPEQDAVAVARRMWDDGHRRVAIFSADQQLGQRTRHAFSEAFTLLGGEVVDEASFTSGQTDFSGELRGLLRMRNRSASGPFQPVIRNDLDAIFLAASGKELALIVPQLDYFGADNLPRYGLGMAYSGNPDRRGDADKDRVIIPIAPVLLAGTAGPEHPLRLAYERAQLAGPLPRLFAVGADAARLAGHIDSLLQGGVLDGLTGELSITPTGVVERQPSWGQFQGGAIKPIMSSSATSLPDELTAPIPAMSPAGGQLTPAPNYSNY